MFSTLVFLISCSLFVESTCQAAGLPKVDKSLGKATVSTHGELLTASTGLVERTWRLTDKGLSTISLKDLRTGKEWVNATPAESDWHLQDFLRGSTAQVMSVTAESSDDAGFTTEHLRVLSEFFYPDRDIRLCHEVWIYPNSNGFRTQVWLKKVDTNSAPPDKANRNLARIKLIEGQAYSAVDATDATPYWLQRGVSNEKQLKLKIEGLDLGGRYHLGVSWWNGGAKAQKQSILAKSVDGEVSKRLVSTVDNISAYGSPLSSVQAEFPQSVNLDGSATIQIENLERGPALLCEMWLYGNGPCGVLDIDKERKVELEKLAPEGMSLVAYFSAAQGDSESDLELAPSSRSEFLPIDTPIRRAVGYFNDTQHRHEAKYHLVRDQEVPAGSIDWASILFLEDAQGGLAIVKESHKCVNQAGVNTGGFVAQSDGVSVTGLGLSVEDLSSEYRWCWATWSVLYPTPSNDARELAVKQYDRTRYPVQLERDLYVKANTWGSGQSSSASIDRAREEEILLEIDSVADLGVETLQIDNGWQAEHLDHKSLGLRPWQPRPDWYPKGWSRISAYAEANNVELSIWFAAHAPLRDLFRAFDEGGFKTYKLDYAFLNSYDKLESYLSKGRALVAHTNHQSRVNWDVTENAPRFGYFWARECGSVWLANRKPERPENVIPKPWLMLREHREISRYLNTSKFEFAVQNFRKVNQENSDAYKYTDSYSLALSFPGIPVLFQTTRLLEHDQRAEIRALLEIYIAERAELFRRYVFPIGEEPDNQSWSGFQWIDPDSETGYVLIFRERLNKQKTCMVSLRFASPGSQLEIDNLLNNNSFSATLDETSSVLLTIEHPGDFLFARYHQINSTNASKLRVH